MNEVVFIAAESASDLAGLLGYCIAEARRERFFQIDLVEEYQVVPSREVKLPGGSSQSVVPCFFT